MKRACVMGAGFASAAGLLARAVKRTRRGLAATGFTCDVQLTLAVHPEGSAMSPSVARSGGLRVNGASATAPTDPAMPAWRGPIGGGR